LATRNDLAFIVFDVQFGNSCLKNRPQVGSTIFHLQSEENAHVDTPTNYKGTKIHMLTFHLNVHIACFNHKLGLFRCFVLIFKSWPLKIFYVEFPPPFCPCHVSTRFLILFRYGSKCSIKQCVSATSGKSVLGL
jgi:hypothetical protein